MAQWHPMHAKPLFPTLVTITRRFLLVCVWPVALLQVPTASAASATADTPPLQPQRYSARVTRVFDGDTLWVQPLEGGAPRKLRLLGIDAPEICQDGGIAARDALTQRVLRQVVQVQVDRFDDYGRGLARLTHDETDVSAWLVAQGLAWSYRWRNSLGPYAEQEAAARKRRLGVFADAQAEVPRGFRQRHGPCQLFPVVTP